MDSSLLRALMFKPRRLNGSHEWIAHLPSLIWLMQQLSPRVFVQLGVAEGNLFLGACQIVEEARLATRCYGVAMPPDATGHDTAPSALSPDPDPHLHADSATPMPHGQQAQSLARWHQAHFSRFSWLLPMHSSHALNNFDSGEIDLLMLDSTKSEAVMAEDFDAWQEKLSDRGIVLIPGVDKVGSAPATLWKTLTSRLSGKTFAAPTGLGVVCVGKHASQHWAHAIGDSLTPDAIALLGDRGQALLDAQSCLSLKVALDSSQARVNELDRVLAEKDRAERQRIAASAPQQSAAEALATLTEKHQALSAELDGMRREHHLAALEVNRLSGELQAMRQSSCWRMTAPVRWAGTSIKQWGAGADVLSRSISWHGGVLQATRRGFEVLRSEGLRGFRSRFQSPAQLAQASQTAGHLPGHPPEQARYHQWLAENDPTDAAAMAALDAKLKAADLRTTFSVVMPVYNPPLDYLKQAIESVQQQIYPHWELCIADDASPSQEVRDMLSGMAAADSRIKLVFCEKNGGISVATNAALGIATGDFIALLDNDDLLTPHALAHMAMAIAEHPEADLLYSDEDKVDEHNVRRDPYFKSDFNYELFLAQNMICHLGVYRRSVVQALGGFRTGVEGAQDWDLALRVFEQVGPARIHHVPRVLYHWRAIAGSTALAIGEKNYAQQAQLKSVKDHLQRIGKPDSSVEMGPAFGLLRVRHAVPAHRPLVSIIIPTRDRLELISMCVESILDKTSYPNYEIIIVDNGSVDPGALDYLNRVNALDKVHVFREDIPFNYSRLVNLGVERARGEYLLLLNNDIEIIQSDWIEEMLSFASQDGVGCVGARLWFPDMTLQHGGVVLGIGGVAGHAHKFLPKGQPGYFSRAAAHQVFSAVTAACLMVRTDIYQQVGGFDEVLQVAFNDIDFCIRVREAGYRNLYTPHAEFIHHESASRGNDLSGEKLRRFQQEIQTMTGRWGHLLDKDPAYSPNLTLEHEDFSLAWPSRWRMGQPG